MQSSATARQTSPARQNANTYSSIASPTLSLSPQASSLVLIHSQFWERRATQLTENTATASTIHPHTSHDSRRVSAKSRTRSPTGFTVKMVQLSRPADDAFTNHPLIYPHFAPTPGLTPFPRRRTAPATSVTSSHPHPHCIAYQVQNELGNLYHAHGVSWCSHTGLKYAGSKNWTKYEDREKVLVLVLEFKEAELGNWRLFLSIAEAIREKYGLDGSVREESLWAYQGGRGVPIRIYVYHKENTDTDDEGEEKEESSQRRPRRTDSPGRGQARTQDAQQAMTATVPTSRRLRQLPVASREWVVDRIERIIAQEGPQRRAQPVELEPVGPTPGDWFTTTRSYGDLHSMQQPTMNNPQVIHTRRPLPTYPSLEPFVEQAISPGGVSWERFNAVIGRYTVAEIHERGSGVAIAPRGFTVFTTSPLPPGRAAVPAQSPQQSQSEPVITAQILESMRIRQNGSMQLLPSMRRDARDQRDAYVLSTGRITTAFAWRDGQWQPSSSRAAPGIPSYGYRRHPLSPPPQQPTPFRPQHEARTQDSAGGKQRTPALRQSPRESNNRPPRSLLPIPISPRHRAPILDTAESRQRPMASRQSSSESDSVSPRSLLSHELLSAIDRPISPMLPQHLPRSMINPFLLDLPSGDTDDSRSRATDDRKSESGDADDEAELQQPTPPITPPADGPPRYRGSMSPAERMAGFRTELRRQTQQEADRRGEPPPEIPAPVHPLQREPVYRATPSGGGLRLPPDVNLRRAGTAEADDDLPSWFLDGEGAAR